MFNLARFPRLFALLLGVLLLGGGLRARAFTSNDAVTAFTSFTNIFYVTSGNNSWIRNQQNAGSGATYFWGQANEIECFIDLYEVTTNAADKKIITNLLNGFSFNNGTGWSGNPYNDDVMWAVMAYARGYLKTGNTTFRDIAKANFDMCYARGWDTNQGGMYWTIGNTNKVAAVNGPASIAAHLMFQIYNDTNYLNKATNIFLWEKTNLFVAATGMIYDGMRVGSPPGGGATTYNQGTFIGAANFLGLTNDAILAANYTMSSMTSGGMLPQYGTNNNNSGFNAIFVRWMTKFMRDTGIQNPYLQWLQDNANAAWNFRRTTDNLSWCQWRLQTPPGVPLYSWDCISSFEILQTVPPTQSSAPGTVTLTAADSSGTSSFGSAGNWSDTTAPSSSNNYVVNALNLRTPADSLPHNFSGSSLLVTNGGGLRLTTSAGAVITVGTMLQLDNAIVSAWTRPATLRGAVRLLSGGGVFDPQSLGGFTVDAPIDGPGTLTVASDNNIFAGFVTLTCSNSYTGGTVINGPDTLQLSNAATLGVSSGALTFARNGDGLTIPFTPYTTANYGLLNLNGIDLGIGNLAGGGGRIVNNDETDTATLTIGNGNTGGGVFYGTLLDHTVGGGSLALAKVGNGTITLAGTNAYTGGTTISGGTLQLGDATAANGVIAGNITNNAQLIFANSSPQTFSGPITGSGSITKIGSGTLLLMGAETYSGGTLISSGTLQLGDGSTQNGTLAGNITNNATLIFANPLSQTHAGSIRGTGALTKSAGGVLTLTATNSYTGATLASAGTLALGANGSLSNSFSIKIASGAVLSATNRSDKTLTLNLGQTLTGSGTINGRLSTRPGSTLNPGDSIGVLTVQSNVTLAGSLVMEINRSNPQTNDQINCAATISAGGTLVVTNLGPSLQAGDTFHLFNQPVAGFASVTLPPLDLPNTAWTNRLATDGTLQVLSTVSTVPTNIGVQILNGSILLSWPLDHVGWRLQCQTNAIGLGTNWFDIPDSTTTNQLSFALDPASPPMFFRLLLP